LTLEYCAQLCHDLNKSIAGAENGIDCYCSDKIVHPEALTDSKDCQTPCTACKNTQRCNTTANGNHTELCGGDGHVAAYRFKCTSPPVPRPYPPPPPPPCNGNGDRECGKLFNPCINASNPGNFTQLPFCNASLPVYDRVTDALSRITLSEKLKLLSDGGSSIAGLGIPSYAWWTEASTGIAGGKTNTTKFAFPITLGMSFNRALVLPE
jgi:hypothetical protein